MCKVVTQNQQRYLIDEEVGPTAHLTSEGEKFIKFLSDKQLTKTADKYSIQQSRSNFEAGNPLPVIPQEIIGLSCLDNFKKNYSNLDLRRNESESQYSGCSDEQSQASHQVYYEPSRNFQEEASCLKPESVETKLLLYHLKNQRRLKRKESKAHISAFNEIIKLNEAHSVDLKSQFDLVNKLRKEYQKTQKPKKKVLKNYSKTLWDVKKCTKYREDLRPKQYSCSPNPLFENTEDKNVSSVFSSKKFYIKSNDFSKLSFPMLTDDQIRNIPQFKDYTRGTPSKVLFIKNIPRKTVESQFVALILTALKKCEISDEGIKCKMLYGRMQGSALVSLTGEKEAGLLLSCLNGCNFNGKLLIGYYSVKNEIT